MAKTSPARFVREVRQELSRVTWPSRKETMVATIGVFVMCALLGVFFLLVDRVISWATQWILT